MDGFSFGKELGKAAVASFVAFLVALWMQALGLDRWLVAAGSGAAGGLVVAATFS